MSNDPYGSDGAQAQPNPSHQVPPAPGQPTAPLGAPPVGAPVPAPGYAYHQPVPESDKSFVVTWLLAWLLGVLGIDRFYLGKVGTGLLKLITLGGLGIWAFIDLILTLTGAQRDKQGRPLGGYDQHKTTAWIITGVFVVLGAIGSAVNGARAGGADDSLADAPAVEAPAEDAPAVEDQASEAAPEEEPVVTVQAWADETFGTFAPVSQTGTGDDLVTLPEGATAAVVTATHDGEANFAIAGLDASNQSSGELLVNTIGAYSGSTALGATALGTTTSLQVTADGNWSVTIAPLSTAPLLPSSGTGDGVFLYDGPASPLTATHDGDANFVIVQDTGSTFELGVLVNEIGAYSGTVPLGAGPSVVTIMANGNWTTTLG